MFPCLENQSATTQAESTRPDQTTGLGSQRQSQILQEASRSNSRGQPNARSAICSCCLHLPALVGRVLSRWPQAAEISLMLNYTGQRLCQAGMCVKRRCAATNQLLAQNNLNLNVKPSDRHIRFYIDNLGAYSHACPSYAETCKGREEKGLVRMLRMPVHHTKVRCGTVWQHIVMAHHCLRTAAVTPTLKSGAWREAVLGEDPASFCRCEIPVLHPLQHTLLSLPLSHALPRWKGT